MKKMLNQVFVCVQDTNMLKFMVCRNDSGLLDIYFSDCAAEFDVKEEDIDVTVFGYEPNADKEQVFDKFALYLSDDICH